MVYYYAFFFSFFKSTLEVRWQMDVNMQFKLPDGNFGRVIIFCLLFNLNIHVLHNFNLAKKERSYDRKTLLQINTIRPN